MHTIKTIKVKRPTIVVGFPGTGLVGSVGAAQLINTLKLEFVGYLTSPQFAPLATIHDYIPQPPVRIHCSEKYNLVIIISEMTIPLALSQELADKIMEFARAQNALQIITLGGISIKENINDVYVVSTDKEMTKSMTEKKLAKPIKEGATTGVAGLLLARGALERFPVLSLLAEAQSDYVDPAAAANVLRVLSKLINIKIDTTVLDKEAKELSAQLKETMIKSKVPHKKEPGVGPMYG